jgi:hypothetical protein
MFTRVYLSCIENAGTALIYVVFDMINNCTLPTLKIFQGIVEKAKKDPIKVVTEVEKNGRIVYWKIQYEESSNTFRIGRACGKDQIMYDPLLMWGVEKGRVFFGRVFGRARYTNECTFHAMIRTAWLGGNTLFYEKYTTCYLSVHRK